MTRNPDDGRSETGKRPNQLSAALSEVFVSTSETTRAVGRAVRAGGAQKIGPRLYTTNLDDAPEVVIRRNLWRVVALLTPGSVVGFRTAVEMKPSPDGTIFLTGAGKHRIDLPGLHLRIVKGPGVLVGDQPFMDHLHIASPARALLESLKPSRKGASTSRGLPRERIEALLERELQTAGEAQLNRIRDAARTLAPELDANAEFAILDSTIGQLLGSRKGRLKAPVALARAAGEPYDPLRLELFQALYVALIKWSAINRPDVLPTDAAFSIISFFDAYFSNFIEGTRFEVEEAREIVFDGKIPSSRPQDAHDVLGTFRLVGSRSSMSRSSLDFAEYEQFEAAVRDAHRQVLFARPDKRPGEFKEVSNVAGLTTFVAAELVRGTLRHGFEIGRGLIDAFQRAAMLMVVLSEFILLTTAMAVSRVRS